MIPAISLRRMGHRRRRATMLPSLLQDMGPMVAVIRHQVVMHHRAVMPHHLAMEDRLLHMEVVLLLLVIMALLLRAILATTVETMRLLAMATMARHLLAMALCHRIMRG